MAQMVLAVEGKAAVKKVNEEVDHDGDGEVAESISVSSNSNINSKQLERIAIAR